MPTSTTLIRRSAPCRGCGACSAFPTQLHALGDVTGKHVLELSCGAGQWSRALAAEGAAVVGFDLSEAQLAAAAQAAGARYPLVQGAAEQLPFASASFAAVFCDHGGLSWAPPHLAVPEAGRILRRPGRLVFAATSPWFTACYDDQAGTVTTQVQHDYFTAGAVADEHGAATYQLTYGGWIRTLREAGLIVEDLIEPRPDPGMRSGYMQTGPPD